MDDKFFKDIPSETQLDLLHERLLNLRNELEISRYGRGRWYGDIEKEIEDVEYRRRLLLDKLSVKRYSQENIEPKIINPSIPEKKWWESTIVQIIFLLAAIAGIIALFL